MIPAKRLIAKALRRFELIDPLPNLNANVLEARNFILLKKAMKWTEDPILEGDYLHQFDYMEDLNERRVRDAQVIGGACCNGSPKIILEIGTAFGRGTALMARNAPNSTIHTLNLPPEEKDKAGELITFAPTRDEIGREYRQQGFTNIRQIYANTATWTPDFGPIDVAFIDGCHDPEFVYNDTVKVLTKCRPGSLILWHDFAPPLFKVYKAVRGVCLGVEQLFADKVIRGNVLHLQDSWVGIYRVS